MELPNKHDQDKLIEKLYNLKFIGDFPQGHLALLVPLDTAVQEVNFFFKYDLTSKQLKTILTEEDILVFKNIDDFVKFYKPEDKKKKR